MIPQMIVRFVWDCIILGGTASCLAMFWMLIFQPPERTAEDAIDYLVPVDLDKIEALLDAAKEGRIRTSVSVPEFQEIQRRRMRLYIEILRRMAHNAGILVRLGNCHCDGNSETFRGARELQDEGIRVRVYALGATAKVRLWMLLLRVHLLPSPVLCDVREICGIAGIEAYERLKTAASMFFVGAMPSKLEELLEHL